ncbi:MAG: ABC transporter permease [Candidatus Competibacteraceae bacterium]|nr:ABC transporter permease [Candidatus Competibacteraceae bacterium]
MINPLPLVIADIRHTRTGVIALILLIAIAVALGVAVSAQERALRTGGNKAADPFDLLVGAPGSQTQLLMSTVYLQPAAVDLIDGSILQAMSQQAGIHYAAPLAFGDSYQGYPVVGTTAQFVSLDGQRTLTEGRLFQSMTEAVIGADVKLALQDRLQARHGQIALDELDADEDDELLHRQITYTVVGRLPRLGSPWDRAIMVPVEAIWRTHGLSTGHRENEILSIQASRQGHKLDWSALKIGPPWDADHIPGVPAIVIKPVSVRDAYVLRNYYRRHDATTAFFPAEVLLELYALLGDARFLFASMAVATQVLVLGAMLLAVFAALALRRRQLGVLRALGASRSYLFAAIWSYTVIVITLGAALGLALGWLTALLLSSWVGNTTGLLLPVSLGTKEFLMVAALIGIGFLLALIPSITAYRHSVASLLRA